MQSGESSDLQPLIDRKVHEAMQANNQELLNSISGMISKISANTSQASLLGIPKFKRKSNEEQYKLNTKVLEQVQQVNSALESSDIDRAKASVIEVEKILKHRQKLIMLADSSDLGWRVVNEYTTNPLASDSEDEKRINKAEARALRKSKSEKSKKAHRSWPYRRPESSPAPVVPADKGSRPKPGLCFSCGKPGHWRHECSQSSAQQNNKISRYTCNSTNECKPLNDCKDNQAANPVACGSSGILPADEEKSKSVSSSSVLEIKTFTPVGLLRDHLHKWQDVSDDTYILNVVGHGYKIPFKVVPESTEIRNNKSARDNPDFVRAEISSLLKKGVILEVPQRPHVVNPLTVAYGKSGKARLVLHCRHINPCLHLFKIKFEDITLAEKLFENDSFMYTFDLKSAYHHIDIFPEHTTYLGFSWVSEDKVKYYVFNSLPFGIASAGHIFTKTLRVIVKYWRSLGYKVILFLDDGICGDASYKSALSASMFVRKSLLEFGFLLADDKCSWQPSRIATWLGHRLDFESNRLYITEERIRRLEVSIESVIFQLRSDRLCLIHVKVLAGVVGQIISLQSVLGKIVCLKTRYMYKCISARASWNSNIMVSAKAFQELQYWLGKTRNLNTQGKQWANSLVKVVGLCLFSDASTVGYGGYLARSDTHGVGNASVTIQGQSISAVGAGLSCMHELSSLPEVSEGGCLWDRFRDAPGSELIDSMCTEVSHEQAPGSELISFLPPEVGLSSQGSCYDVVKDTEVYGSWSCSEAKESSTWRELEAFRRVLKTNAVTLESKNVVVFTDNKNVTYILSSGSNIESLHSICLDIHAFCKLKNINVIATWLPRSQNVQADHLSRCLDCDDWSVSDCIFKLLDLKWGPHSVDRFATHYNNKCKRFNSKWWVPGTEVVDTFTQRWECEMNWLVPPPACIIDCLNKMLREQVLATLVVPRWESALFWLLLIKGDGTYRNFVKDVYVLPLDGALKNGFGNNGVGLKQTLKRKFDEAGVAIDNRDNVINRMSTHILAAKADSTVSKYSHQAKQFKEFCAIKHFPCDPAHSIHVAMYLSTLIDMGKSDSVVTAAFYGIKWLHNINDYTDPTDNQMVKAILECAKRCNSKPVCKKDVVSTELLIQLCDMFIDSTDVITLRDLTMMLLSFAGFLRFNEVSDLRCCDVKINDNHLVLQIKKSKTDIYRKGKEVLIAKGVSSACPVAMLQRYLQCAHLSLDSTMFLFRPACRSGSKCFLLQKDKKISYTRAKECIVSKLKMVAPDSKLGLHSLRASGATMATNAEGVSERCLKRHGRWKSDQAKDGYIDDSLEK